MHLFIIIENIQGDIIGIIGSNDEEIIKYVKYKFQLYLFESVGVQLFLQSRKTNGDNPFGKT